MHPDDSPAPDAPGRRVTVAVLLLALLALLAPHARRLRAARKAAPAGTARADDGAFPWRIFAVVGSLAFLFMVTFYVMPTRLPFLLESLGVSNAMAMGAIMATMTLVSVPGALGYGRLRQVMSAMAVFALSFGLMGAGLVVIGLADGPGMVLAGVVLMGVGMGPSMPNYTTFFMAHVPPSQRGRGAGLLTSAFFAGQFASPLVSAPLVAAFGMAGAFEVLGVVLIVLEPALLAAGLVRRAPPAAVSLRAAP